MNIASDHAETRSSAASLRLFLRDFFAYAGRRGVVVALAMALGAVFESLSLVLIIPLLGVVIGTGAPAGRLGGTAATLFRFFAVESPFGKLTLLLGIFTALMLVRALVISFRDVSVAKLQSGFTEARRLRLAERLAGAQWHQIVRLRHARVAHVISGDILRIALIAQALLGTIVAATMLLGQSALVFLLTPVLALAALGLLLAAALVFIPIVRRARAIGKFVSQANLTLLDTTTQFLGSLKLAMSQNLQTRFVAEFQKSLHELTRRQVEFIRGQSLSRTALSTLSALAGAAVVLIGFGAFQIDAPTLVTLLVIMTRMTGPITQIQQNIQQLANALPAYENVKALEAELATIPMEPSGQGEAPPPDDGPIVFEHVSFRHSAGEDEDAAQRGVEDVSFTIEPQTFVGISGPSGAGKTKLADLPVGLFPPQHGRITISGAPLDGATLSAWRERISYVSQDPFLFHDTVRNNLAWAAPRADESDMWHALGLTGADALVRGMPAGLDTLVGERGTLVSGGERQRIALARAILRRPRLLVLDEATSALDVASEQQILGRLRALTPRPTIVIIAHRAESLTLCDRVLHLQAGRCNEGTAPACGRRTAIDAL